VHVKYRLLNANETARKTAKCKAWDKGGYKQIDAAPQIQL